MKLKLYLVPTYFTDTQKSPTKNNEVAMKLKKMMIQLSEPCSECDGSGYVITDQVTGCCIPDVGFVEKCTECGGKAIKAAHNMTVEEFIKLLKQQKLL